MRLGRESSLKIESDWNEADRSESEAGGILPKQGAT